MASNMLLDKLQKARDLKEPELLEMAIKDCKAAGIDDHEGVAKAETQLQVIRMKMKLERAMQARNTNAISGVINEVEGLGFHKHVMYHEILAARNVVERKRRLAELKHDILDMDRKTMSEMRSYNHPPMILHRVLQAALLLLGEDEETTSIWRKCRACCVSNGRDGLQRKMMKFDASRVQPDQVVRCREILDNYTVNQAQVVSAGAATFYVWARGVIDEVERKNQGSEQPVEPATTQQQAQLMHSELESPS
ncbi:hypothetical protein LSAT2_004330 [Lamellibrachia satsuma]|nr:hypothetical protein LSAT2_004330 [Lamellibrachia satsuma]